VQFHGIVVVPSTETISAPPPGNPRCNSAGALAEDESDAHILSTDNTVCAAGGQHASADPTVDFRSDL
jgi:hypothetical protein